MTAKKKQDLLDKSLLWIAGLSLLTLVGYILVRFNFAYTDMDQVMMWYGASEFRSGDFHMFRYFGQEYGTMLEALLGSVLIGVPFHISLPLVTAFLLLFPYAVIANTNGNKLDSWLLPIGFLLLFPPEFFMLGFMPRDFVTGTAVVSLSLFLLNKKSGWSYFLIGFICIIAWSMQQNSALFGAVVSVYAAFKTGRLHIRNSALMAAGYAFGALLHLASAYYYQMHPEFIVHHAWDFHYAWKQVWDGWLNLKRHWAWITLALHYQGWFYVVILVTLLVVTYIKKQWALFMATLTLCVITFASFGVLKIHDARDSVFFSHERMYLALPVSILFILSKLKTTIPISRFLVFGGLLLLPLSLFRFEGIKNADLEKKREHVVQVRTVEEFYSKCELLESLADKYKVNAVLIGPNYSYFDIVSTHGCGSVVKDIRFLFPEYERKTWDMRDIKTDGTRRFLFHYTGELERDQFITDLSKIESINGLYLIELEDQNPLEYYQSKGFSVSAH
jgi:hypothetical protein